MWLFLMCYIIRVFCCSFFQLPIELFYVLAFVTLFPFHHRNRSAWHPIRHISLSLKVFKKYRSCKQKIHSSYRASNLLQHHFRHSITVSKRVIVIYRFIHSPCWCIINVSLLIIIYWCFVMLPVVCLLTF